MFPVYSDDPKHADFMLTGDNDSFAGFLYFLTDKEEGGYTAHAIIGVVEKPWHWTKEFVEWWNGARNEELGL